MHGMFALKFYQAVLSALEDCVVCKYYNDYLVKYSSPASFPASRVSRRVPFVHTRVDYTGHLWQKRMVGRLKDVHVFRGVAASMSELFLIEAKVVVAKEWGNRVVGCRREVVKVEELKKKKQRKSRSTKTG